MTLTVEDLRVLRCATDGVYAVELAATAHSEIEDVVESLERLTRAEMVSTRDADGALRVILVDDQSRARALRALADVAKLNLENDYDLPAAPFLHDVTGFMSPANLASFGDAFPTAFSMKYVIDQTFANIITCDPALRYAGDPARDTLIVAHTWSVQGACRVFSYDAFATIADPYLFVAKIKHATATTLQWARELDS